jgi:hypothetical protein
MKMRGRLEATLTQGIAVVTSAGTGTDDAATLWHHRSLESRSTSDSIPAARSALESIWFWMTITGRIGWHRVGAKLRPLTYISENGVGPK